MKRAEYGIGKAEARLLCFMHEDLTGCCESYKRHPAVIIFPGGGYRFLSPREEEPIAAPLFAEGYNVFILRYSVGSDIALSEPEEEAAEAVSIIKRDSDELGVDKDRIAVLGFSAGAHAAASLACHWKRYGEESRPDTAVLCYPVITMGKYCHEGSRDRITMGDEKRLEYFSLENQVDKDTVPCFIWHTEDDQSVPIQNSLLFLEALIEHGVKAEYHMYDHGKHGLSTGYRMTGPEEKGVQSWVGLLVSYLNRRWNFLK